MKVYITEPPRMGKTTPARLDNLIVWLTSLAEKLNIAFESIGEENLSRELRERLGEVSE